MPELVVYRRANRQYIAMTEQEVWSFLSSQRRIFLGFAKKDGYPHVTPIWFVTRHRRIYMRAQDYKVKVKLVSLGRACCVIDEGDRYKELRGVVVWGKTRILEEKKLLKEVLDDFEEKYAEQQWKPAEMPQRWVAQRSGEEKVIIELDPETVDSWDNRKVR